MLGVEHQCIHHPAAHQQGIEGPLNEVSCTQVIGLFGVDSRLLCGDHDHRNFLDPVLMVHGLQYLKAIHFRHDDIQQEKINEGVLLHQLQGFPSVFYLHDIVVLSQHFPQQTAVHGRIIRNEYFLSVLHKRVLQLPII